jgi:hypothetical protein
MVKHKSDGADAERKALERQQAKRNKKAKEKAASAALLTRDVADLERDIRRLERENTKATAAKLVELRAALESQRAAKALAEQLRLDKHKKRLARKGLKPQDSPHYDAVANPWGLPPLDNEAASSKKGPKRPPLAAHKPPRPPGDPPAVSALVPRFIPPMPSEPWPHDAAIVPHPRQDLIEKDAIDRLVRESERQFRQAERTAARQGASGAAVSSSAVPTRQEMLRREQHAQVHQPVPAAADVRVDPAALRLVPTAVRVKRDSSAVASVASGGDAPPRKSARHAEPQQPNKLDDAFASFMHDIDNLNS